MTVVSARWVLFLSLLIVLPWPFFIHQWSWLPAAYVLQHLFTEVFNNSAPIAISTLLVFRQVVCALTVFFGLARLYGYFSANWLAKFRGSIVGLLALTLLIGFSSVAVYEPLRPDSARSTSDSVGFLEIYHQD